MKRGISVTRDYDYHNTPCVVITKKRGKLTIPEITDILHYEDQQRWSGRYALLLDCTEVLREYHKSRKRRESMITTGQAYRHGAPVHDCPVPHTKMAAVSAVAQRKERT